MKDGGLLFLKYIRTIILRFDNDIVAKLQILENDPDSLKARNELPLDFQRLYVEQESSILRQDITKIFELQIEYSDGQVSSVDRYLVQHTMLRSTGNQELDKWARKRKLFPWTAVAAPLNVSQSMLHKISSRDHHYVWPQLIMDRSSLICTFFSYKIIAS